MIKQCKFYDYESQNIEYGIIDNDDNVICLECGGLFEKDEIYAEQSISPQLYSKNNENNCMIKILNIYDNNEWTDLSEPLKKHYSNM